MLFCHCQETELIYIHAKLMVVDDRKLIIGSSNLADRSILGFRDLETAILAEETHDNGRLRSVYFDGQRVVVGVAVRRLRRSLMTEHLGVLTGRRNHRSTLHFLTTPFATPLTMMCGAKWLTRTWIYLIK